jgi:hypothetical protein
MDPFVFRLMYKNQYSMSVTAMNIYMVILKSSLISEQWKFNHLVFRRFTAAQTGVIFHSTEPPQHMTS